MANTKGTTVKASEAANSEGRWLSIFENMKDTIMTVSRDCVIQTINRVQQGFTKEDVIGKPVFYFVTPHKAEYIKQNIKKLLKMGSSFEVEDSIHGPDGTDAWYYSVYSPIINATGKIDEFMIITRNITMMKQAEFIVLNAIIEGQETERKRVSGDLHDGLGQNLSALNLNLMNLESDLKKLKSAKAEKTFVNMRLLLGKAGEEVKSITHNLAPPRLEKDGLVLVIDDYCRQAYINFGVKVGFKSENMDKRLNAALELAVYRMVQELVNNSVKHSGTKKIDVVLKREPNKLVITVSDKGKGFNTAKRSSGLGLQNINTRAKMHKGEAIINSKPGKGPVVTVNIPLYR